MADLYSELGVARGASEADIKKAYRKLAKELHPDRTRTIPRRPSASRKVTQAYDILTDKDKRAQYDRGEIDEDGNPQGAVRLRRRRPRGRRGGGFRAARTASRSSSAAAARRPIFPTCSKACSAAAARRGGGGRSAASAGAARRRRRAPTSPTGSTVPFEDAATLEGQRVTLGSGKTLDIKLPAGRRGRHQDPPRRPGPGRARAAMATRSSPSRSSRTASSAARATISGSICRSRSTRRCSAPRCAVPTVDGPVMLSVPKGSSSGKVLRLKGKGFTGKNGQRGDQLVTLMVDVPADDAELARFLEGWSGKRQGEPAGGLGV